MARTRPKWYDNAPTVARTDPASPFASTGRIDFCCGDENAARRRISSDERDVWGTRESKKVNISRILITLLLVLSLLAGSAAADSITGGHLFAVFAEGGDFSGLADPVERYTVAHLFTFGPSVFPDSLEVLDFPAFFSDGSIPVIPGGELFLIGAVLGDVGFPNHLLLSSATTSDQPDLSAVDEPLHSDLIAGALDLATMPPIGSMTAHEFWSLFSADPNAIASSFFSIPMDDSEPVGPIGTLGADGGFVEGGEDIFGFDPPFFSVGLLFGDVNDPIFQNDIGQTFRGIPEPGSVVLLGLGLAGVVGAARRRRRRLAA